MSDERRLVPIREAIVRIGDCEQVHTFMAAELVLIGADHDRDDLIEAMRLHGVEEAGPRATAIGHTLVIVNYPLRGTREVTPLFIEAKPRPVSV